MSAYLELPDVPPVRLVYVVVDASETDCVVPDHSPEGVSHGGTVPHHRATLHRDALAEGVSELVRYEHHHLPRVPGMQVLALFAVFL